MPLMTSSAVLALRRLLRATGLAGPISSLLGRNGYESRFGDSMESAIRPGDCVWDVGANVGYYTARFARIATDAGHVFGFEPSPHNGVSLKAAVAGLTNVTVMPMGLSDRAGQAAFIQGADDLGATSKVRTDLAASDAGMVTVELGVGDELVAQGRARAPNVIKVDVEGHEYEVLRGLTGQLRNPALRDIFIEVHFDQLDQAGRPEVPGQIEALLKSCGLATKWIDPSHLQGHRTVPH